MAESVVRPLAVDLDGTLTKTDLLQETASSFIASRPLGTPQLLLWLCSGLCTLKAKLASCRSIEIETLPWNQELLAWLRQEKIKGRHLVLATASHRILARQVQQHLQLFDEVLATEHNINLRREQKRQALVAKYGERGFDYVGNSKDDLAVWSSAARAYLVSDSATLLRKARKLCTVDKVFASGKPPLWRSLLLLLRTKQWLKNILVLLPLITSHSYGNAQSLMLAGIAFILVSLGASSTYVLNDLINCAHDRHDPNKSKRPFAAGDLSLASGWLLWLALLLGTITVSIVTMPTIFSIVLFCYLLATWLHSPLLKQFASMDVLALTFLYTIMVVAGAVAINVILSYWLLVFFIFIFLSLALIKRYGKLQLTP
ncbi:MAG: UbiA family prenyltransferase [Candidatus Porifericomitaceae bacterium WSBS_2022_MAG_OTU9]